MLLYTVLVSVLGIAVAVLHIRVPHANEPFVLSASSVIAVNRTMQEMMAAPSNLSLQRQSCQTLLDIANHNREGFAPFGGRRIATALLEAGFGEASAQGLLNSLSNGNESDVNRKDAASKCFDAITCVNVQNDHNKSLAFINNSPNAWEAIVTYLYRYRHDRSVLLNIDKFASFYGSCTPESSTGLAKAGAFELIFRTLKDNGTDAELFHNSFVALSDHVRCSKEVARIVANIWGPLTGVQALMNALSHTRQSGVHFRDKHGFGTLYEIMQSVNGLLEHDENHTFLQAFSAAGLINELKFIIQSDDDRRLQDNICQTLKWLTDNNTALQKKLVDSKAMRFMARVLMQFAHPPYKDSCTVTHSCSTVLLNFARTNTAWLDKLIEYRVDDTFDKEVLDTYRGWTDFAPWRQYFPSGNIFELHEILQKRKKELNKTG